jgi:hypothetical protein
MANIPILYKYLKQKKVGGCLGLIFGFSGVNHNAEHHWNSDLRSDYLGKYDAICKKVLACEPILHQAIFNRPKLHLVHVRRHKIWGNFMFITRTRNKLLIFFDALLPRIVCPHTHRCWKCSKLRTGFRMGHTICRPLRVLYAHFFIRIHWAWSPFVNFATRIIVKICFIFHTTVSRNAYS